MYGAETDSAKPSSEHSRLIRSNTIMNIQVSLFPTQLCSSYAGWQITDRVKTTRTNSCMMMSFE